MMPRAGQAGNPNSFYEDTQAQLEQAKLRAAQTAHALKNAPRAQYPTPAALAQPAQRPAATPAAPSAAPAPAGAAQAPVAQPATVASRATPTREQIAAGTGRLNAASDTPNVDAVLGVNRRAIERSGKGLDSVRSEAADAAKRRQALREKLRMSAFAMSNPGASPLEADMYRRGGG